MSGTGICYHTAGLRETLATAVVGGIGRFAPRAAFAARYAPQEGKLLQFMLIGNRFTIDY